MARWVARCGRCACHVAFSEMLALWRRGLRSRVDDFLGSNKSVVPLCTVLAVPFLISRHHRTVLCRVEFAHRKLCGTASDGVTVYDCTLVCAMLGHCARAWMCADLCGLVVVALLSMTGGPLVSRYPDLVEHQNHIPLFGCTDHPFYVGSQYHPEYLSRPIRPSPLFLGLILAGAHLIWRHMFRNGECLRCVTDAWMGIRAEGC